MTITLPRQMAYLAQATRQQVTGGESDASVYRLTTAEGTRYLKITAHTSPTPVHDEYLRLQWLQDKVPVPRVIDYAQTQSHQFLLMSACEGYHPLHDDLSWNTETRLRVLAQVTNQFHSIDTTTCPYRLILDHQIAQAQRLVADNRLNYSRWQWLRGNQSVAEGLEQLQALKPDHVDAVVAHGDLYPVNMRVDAVSQQLAGVIDVGRCAIADRYTDLALIVNAIGWHLDDTAIERFFELYGITPDTQKLRFYQLLHAFR